MELRFQTKEENEQAIVNQTKTLRWCVLSSEDLITSKIKSGRPKDPLDIQQLTATNNF